MSQNQQIPTAKEVGALALAGAVGSVVGSTATVIAKPAGGTVLHILVESGDFRVKLGNHTAREFTAVAATDLVTITAHGMEIGDGPFTVATSDALPGGLEVDTPYWVRRQTADTFKLATSKANALAGTMIDITDAGTGTHTFGAISASAPGASVTNGTGSIKIASGTGTVLAGPDSVTVIGSAADAILTYWWV